MTEDFLLRKHSTENSREEKKKPECETELFWKGKKKTRHGMCLNLIWKLWKMKAMSEHERLNKGWFKREKMLYDAVI